jgi:hypothetical protein
MVSLKKENRRRVQGAVGIGIIDKQGREKGRCEVVVVEMSHHLFCTPKARQPSPETSLASQLPKALGRVIVQFRANKMLSCAIIYSVVTGVRRASSRHM